MFIIILIRREFIFLFCIDLKALRLLWCLQLKLNLHYLESIPLSVMSFKFPIGDGIIYNFDIFLNNLIIIILKKSILLVLL